MFGKKKPAPEPAPEAKPASEPADDVKNIKAWIVDIAGPKFKDLADREQRNRDYVADVNSQCKEARDEIRKYWKEKELEKENHAAEIAGLKKTIRELKAELDTKANKAKSAPGKKPGA